MCRTPLKITSETWVSWINIVNNNNNNNVYTGVGRFFDWNNDRLLYQTMLGCVQFDVKFYRDMEYIYVENSCLILYSYRVFQIRAFNGETASMNKLVEQLWVHLFLLSWQTFSWNIMSRLPWQIVHTFPNCGNGLSMISSRSVRKRTFRHISKLPKQHPSIHKIHHSA